MAAESPTTDSAAFEAVAKAVLAARIVWWWAIVRWRVHRDPLPDLVADLAAARPARWYHPVRRLSRAVDRVLRLGSRQPTCLVSALVLFRLLRGQDRPAHLVIGLLPAAPNKDAHAWVEVFGVDLGPPPGRGRHVEMARYR